MKPSYPSRILASAPALYLVLSLTAFFPCLFLGQAYFDNDLLAQFGPWRSFLRDQLAQGHFPLWNPYNLGGQPFFADLQNMMLYPLNWLTLLFPVAYGLSLFFFIHMFWAAAGMHLWLASLGLSEKACRVGAVLFACSGFFWLEIIHPPILAAFAWTPWLFYFLEEWTGRPRPKAAFAAGLSFAMLFLCGSFQMTVGALYGGAAYFGFRLLTPKPPTRPKILRWALLFLWGALPLLAQFIPTLEFSRLTVRGSAQPDYAGFSAKPALKALSLHQFLFPRLLLPEDKALDHMVQEFPENGTYDWAGNWGYLGIWAPLLGLAALRRKGSALPLFLAAFALAWLAVALGPATPLHRIFCGLLPGFSLLRAPFRFLFLYVLGASALAAFGFEALSSPGKKNNSPKLLLILGGLLLIPSLAAGLHAWRETLSLSLGLGALGWRCFRPSRTQREWPIFQAALFLPLLLSGWGDYPTGPSSNFDFVKNSMSLPQISQAVRPLRVIFGNQMLYPIQTKGQKYVVNYPQNAAVVFHLKNFGGYNPLAMSVKKDLARLPMAAAESLGALTGILSMDPNLKIEGFQPHPFPPFTLYLSEKTLALAFAPGLVELIPDRAERLKRMERPGFDPEQEALLSEAPPGLILPASRPAADLKWDLREDGVDQQAYEVELNRDNLVVFSEVAFPGWNASVDGSPAPLFTADHFLRALVLPAGRHQVVFRFEPVWVHPIEWGLILWILLTAGFWFLKGGPFRKFPIA